jgi:hypothetical protein
VLPFVVAGIVKYRPDRLNAGIGLLVAFGLVVAVARRPQKGLMALTVLLPFQLMLLSFAFKLGLSASLVRDAGYWKELAVAGCVIAAVRHMASSRQRLDAIDFLGLVYILIAVLYRLLPHLFVHPAGPFAIGPPTDGPTLNTAFRNDTVFVFVLLAVRHLPLDPRFRARFSQAVLIIGGIVAVLGIYEFVDSASWNHLLVRTLGVTNYQHVVLKEIPPNIADIRIYSQLRGQELLRIGSIFVDQLACGFYLVAAFAVGVERLLRPNTHRFVTATTTLAISIGILLTETRSAILAAAIVVLLALRPLPQRDRGARIRLGLLIALGLLVVTPFALSTGLVARTLGALNGQDQSAQLHVQRSSAGIADLVRVPLGRGLGTGGGNGTRFDVSTTLTTEDYYLQVGNETGVVSLAAFGGLTIVLNRRMGRATLGSGDETVSSWRGACLGLTIAGLLIPVWTNIAVSTTVWLGLGLCLGAAKPDLSAADGRYSHLLVRV